MASNTLTDSTNLSAPPISLNTTATANSLISLSSNSLSTGLSTLNACTLTASNLNTNSPNSNDSSHNLSLSSTSSSASISNLNKVLETQPKSTDSGIGSEKSW